MLILLWLIGCTPKPLDVVPDTDIIVDDTGIGPDTDLDSDTDTDTDTDIEDPNDVDGDGDGYSINDGDCDDTNAAIHPGVEYDICDGIDNDCDTLLDEDIDGDKGEVKSIGNLTDSGTYQIDSMLFPEADIDTYEFKVEDGVTDWFGIDVYLTNVPEDADYRIELFWFSDDDGSDRGLVASADKLDVGGDETIEYEGKAWRDDTGWYRLVVSSVRGASCSSTYNVNLVINDF